MQPLRTVEERMEDFVAAFGCVPPGARKLRDYEARQHRDIWIRRLLGEGIVCQYVIGYQHENNWWTFCFDRREGSEEMREDERWVVEAYDSFGGSWRGSFLYESELAVWRRAPMEDWESGSRPSESSGVRPAAPPRSSHH